MLRFSDYLRNSKCFQCIICALNWKLLTAQWIAIFSAVNEIQPITPDITNCLSLITPCHRNGNVERPGLLSLLKPESVLFRQNFRRCLRMCGRQHFSETWYKSEIFLILFSAVSHLYWNDEMAFGADQHKQAGSIYLSVRPSVRPSIHLSI